MAGSRRWALLVVLAVVVVVNLVQFRSIDAVRDGAGYAALGRLSSSDVMTLARDDPHMEGAYGMYLELRAASPRSHLTGATSGVIEPAQLRDLALSFGDSATVTIATFDDSRAPLPADLIATGGIVAAHGSVTVDGRIDVPWHLITGQCGVDPGPTVGRHLVIVRWGHGATLAVGLVESCLLPAGFTESPA